MDPLGFGLEGRGEVFACLATSQVEIGDNGQARGIEARACKLTATASPSRVALGNDLMHHLAMNVGEAILATLKLKS